MFIEIFLVIAALAFGLQAIRAPRLINSALWLAGASALVALLLFLAGAQTAAVIELSVGAGLVTVLFAFAISISGEDLIDLRSIVSRPLGALLVVLAVGLLLWLTQPAGASAALVAEPGVSETIWEVRGLDILVQVALIFAGVLGLLGLLAEEKPPLQNSAADEFILVRNQELETMREEQLEGKRL
jgi:NADH:ubiquinone oxidoreductase subunit 6 (subunit J)